MVKQETICTCDICGKEMRESVTGHNRWQCNLILGSNIKDVPDIRYDDVCYECADAIRDVINTRKGVSPVNHYSMEKLADF